jgi:hypothetical protein
VRTRARYAFLVAALLTLFPAWTVSASPQPGESLEWQVADSDLVVRGTVAHVVHEPGNGTRVWERVTIDVVEVIKGPKLGEVTFSDVRFSDHDFEHPWDRPGRELLLFLVRTDGLRPAEHPKRSPGFGRCPYTLRWPMRAICMDQQLERLMMTIEWRRLRSPQEVLVAARRAAAEERSPIPLMRAYVTPPGGQPDWPSQHLTALAFPVDYRVERYTREWISSREPWLRLQAARTLGLLPSLANTSLLLSLLTDPFHETHGRTPWTRRKYPIREAAQIALLRWGVPAPPTITAEPAGFYRPFWPVFAATTAVAVVASWSCVRLFRRTRGQPMARRWRVARALGELCGSRGARGCTPRLAELHDPGRRRDDHRESRT